MLRRLALMMLMGTAAILVPNAAFAQDEGEQVAPPPPPPPPPAPAPAPAPVRRTTVATPPGGAAGSDHEEVVGSLGFQISRAASQSITVMGTTVGIDVNNLGLRYWFNDKIGLDAGFGFSLAHFSPDVGDGDTAIGFGINAGVPIAIGVYKHITTYFAPRLDFFFFKLGTNDGDPDSAIKFDLNGCLGFEWQMGWIEASRISLSLELGAGLTVTSKLLGNVTTVNFATGFPGSASVEDLFSSRLALTFYL